MLHTSTPSVDQVDQVVQSLCAALFDRSLNPDVGGAPLTIEAAREL